MSDILHTFTFRTGALDVVVTAYADWGYRYDGDDEGGETQAQLDAGDLVAFDTVVKVVHRATAAIIGRADLGGSVYAWNEVDTFFNAHRDPNPMNRNCSVMRDAHPDGPRVSICHYFPDMVREACRDARETLREIQAIAVRPAAGTLQGSPAGFRPAPHHV